MKLHHKNDRENVTLPKPAHRIPPLSDQCNTYHYTYHVPAGGVSSGSPPLPSKKRGMRRARGQPAVEPGSSALAGHTFLHRLYVGIVERSLDLQILFFRFQIPRAQIPPSSKPKLKPKLSIPFAFGTINNTQHLNGQASEACLMIFVLCFYGRQLHLLLSTNVD